MALLTIQKNYSITLDSGREAKLDASTSVDNVGEIISREAKVPFGSEVTLVLIGAAIAAGQMTDVKFCIIQNLDTTNFVRLRLEDTGGHTMDVKLLPKQCFDVYNTKISVSETGAAFSAFSDIDTVSAQADTGDVNVAIFTGESC